MIAQIYRGTCSWVPNHWHGKVEIPDGIWRLAPFRLERLQNLWGRFIGFATFLLFLDCLVHLDILCSGAFSHHKISTRGFCVNGKQEKKNKSELKKTYSFHRSSLGHADRFFASLMVILHKIRSKWSTLVKYTLYCKVATRLIFSVNNSQRKALSQTNRRSFQLDFAGSWTSIKRALSGYR